MVETPPSPGQKPATEQPQRPGATRAVFIVLGIGLTALAAIGLIYQVAMALMHTPDKDLATMAIQGVIAIASMAAGFIFGRMGSTQ